jgi:predicted O-linked N-acetylglucosamine transferase (SPINDLY family)
LSHDLRSVTALLQSGRAAEALAACADLARGQPANGEVASMHAYLLWQNGRADDAIAEGRRACELSPTSPGMLVNLARILMTRDDLSAVLDALDKAQALKPDWVEPAITAAEACIKAGHFHAAAERCRAAIPRWPTEPELAWTLANALHFAGKNDQAVEVLAPISARNPTDLRLLSAIAHYSNYIPTWTREQVFEAHKKFGRALTRFHSVPAPAFTPDPLESRRVRVGLISPDLREHSVSFFVRPLLEHLDRTKVELFAYHTYTADDSTTGALSQHAEHWRAIRTKNPDEIAAATSWTSSSSSPATPRATRSSQSPARSPAGPRPTSATPTPPDSHRSTSASLTPTPILLTSRWHRRPAWAPRRPPSCLRAL